ncbi:MAG: type 1 glutamine amidotransferase, partial [Paracoccaceae bacterium]|nr:type 1 glutamine amidotransferase [Paracoccaceae bacterium]
GHQAIAMALGGAVEKNPEGWVFGLAETISAPMSGEKSPIRLYAAHLEQVTALPEGARVLGGSPGCPLGSFAMGDHVFTTQYHPEMTHAFIAALTDHLDGILPPEVIAASRASLVQRAETDRMAGWIIGFFEQAQDSAAKRSIAVI